MVDVFLINAIIGGFGIAIVAGILGSFVLWQNMAYFGDALSHSALLGVAIGILFNLNLALSVAFIAIAFAFLFNNKLRYSNDTTLGILSYSSLSLAIIISSYNKIKIDLMGYLFGDILAINLNDLYCLAFCIIIVSTWVYLNWSKLVLLSVSPELLQAEGVNIHRLKLCFTLILALFVAIAFKIVGILLITAMLIIPAASALSISRTPLQMILYSIIIGIIGVIIGTVAAIFFDLPTGPTIILSSSGCLLLINIARLIKI